MNLLGKLRIQSKIVLGVTALLIATVSIVAIVVFQQSRKWFSEDAKIKLDTAANVLLMNIATNLETQQKNLAAIAEDENVVSPVSIIGSLLIENSREVFDEAYVEMTKTIALRLESLSEREGYDLLQFFDAKKNLLAFYKSDGNFAGWLRGNGKFGGAKGGVPVEDLVLPRGMGKVSFQDVPLASLGGYSAFDGKISLYTYSPVFEILDEEKQLVGFMEVNKLLDDSYAKKISELSGTQINFFIEKEFSAGVVTTLKSIPDSYYSAIMAMADKSNYADNNSDLVLDRDISTDGASYYAKFSPFIKDKKLIGAMSILFSKEHAQTKTKNTVVLLVIITAASGLVGSLISTVLAKAIAGQLSKAVHVANRLAEGDLTVNIDATGSDEIGLLLNSMNNMVKKLKGIVGQVRDSADNVATASQELRNGAGEMSAGMITQSEKAMQISAASMQMSQTVQHIAGNAASIAASALETASTARDGAAIVNNSVAEVNGIADAVVASAKMISSLGERSTQIGEIVDVINDIADQTNLLALNAAIEAARAGEQGRGFAVVADEVRKLAERTGSATSKIADMIRAIQSEVQTASIAMEDGTQRVKVGVELSSKAGEALSNIVESVTGLQSMVQQIASATDELSSGSENTTADISSIADVANSTSESSSRISEQAAALADHSAMLQGVVGQFILESGQ